MFQDNNSEVDLFAYGNIRLKYCTNYMTETSTQLNGHFDLYKSKNNWGV